MEWKDFNLGEVCTATQGVQIPKSKQIIEPESGYKRYLYISDFKRNDKLKFVEDIYPKKVVTGEDIIVSNTGSQGEVYRGIDGILSNNLFKVTINKELVDRDFLYLFLQSPQFIDFQNARILGTTQPHMGHKNFLATPILLPPIPEQKRIVAILDQAFADIEQARAKTEQNLKNARELFESYLQQVFSQRGEGWEESELFEHVKFIDYRGKTPKKTEQGLRLITAKNVRMGYLKVEPQEFVAPESYEGWMTRGIPQKGDVLFTTEAPLANVAQLDTDEKTVFAQRIITMQPDQNILNSTFLKYMLMSQPIQQLIHDKGTGATCTGIKASLLKKIPITYPSDMNEQVEYVDVLDSLTDKVKLLESIYIQKLSALDNLKKSILQKAFSGELTAKDVA